MSLTTTFIAEKLKARLEELTPDPPAEVLAVYETAKDQFGEENVDLQKYSHEAELRKLIDGRFFTFLRAIGLSTSPYEDYRDYSVANYFSSERRLDEFLATLRTSEVTAQRMPLYAIFVKFSNFQVTNEQDASVDIEEMFQMHNLTYSGRLVGRQYWCRTKSSGIHAAAHYRHSHLHVASDNLESYGNWCTPCLGTGPITLTGNSLQDDCDLDLWRLYWLESDQCIRVESISGGPYYRMGTITSQSIYQEKYTGINDWSQAVQNLNEEQRRLIAAMLQSGQLKWCWNTNRILIGHSLSEFFMLASNTYLDMLRADSVSDEEAMTRVRELVAGGHLITGQIIHPQKVVKLQPRRAITTSYHRELGWSFKGEEVCLDVTPCPEESIPYVYLLPYQVICILYNALTLLANSSYGKQQFIQRIKSK